MSFSKILSSAAICTLFSGFLTTNVIAEKLDLTAARDYYLENCAGCHGDNAEGTDGMAPRIRFEKAWYFIRSIQDFKKGLRYPDHKEIAAPIGPKLARALARLLEAQGEIRKPMPVNASTKKASIYYLQNCAFCHGKFGEGTDHGNRLRNQWATYTAEQLNKIIAETRHPREMKWKLSELENDRKLLESLAKYLQAEAVSE